MKIMFDLQQITQTLDLKTNTARTGVVVGSGEHQMTIPVSGTLFEAIARAHATKAIVFDMGEGCAIYEDGTSSTFGDAAQGARLPAEGPADDEPLADDDDPPFEPMDFGGDPPSSDDDEEEEPATSTASTAFSALAPAPAVPTPSVREQQHKTLRQKGSTDPRKKKSAIAEASTARARGDLADQG